MKSVKCIYKVLAVFILIGLAAALCLSWQRNQVESAANTVEMVYDYDNIIETAFQEKKSPDELFDLYRESGITSLAVYDETPKKLLDHGEIAMFQGTDLISLTGAEGLYPSRIYLQPIQTEKGKEIFRETARSLSLRLNQSDMRRLSVNGTDTIEINGSYSRFADMDLGLFPSQVKEAASHGFYVVLRPKNAPHASRAVLNELLEAADASPKVSAVLFEGKQAFGFRDGTSYISEELKRRHIPVVLIEAQNQLQFERQDGTVGMVRNMDYSTVRLYAMSKDELVKINQEEAASRFYISDLERNIRMNLFASYKEPLNGETLSETNAKYIRLTAERLTNRGFTLGKASVMAPYFPSKVLRAAVMVGALSLCCAALFLVIPAGGNWRWLLWLFGLAGTQGLFWFTHSLIPLQLLALGSAVSIPVLSVTLFLNYCVRREHLSWRGWMPVLAEGLAVIWTAGLMSLMGAFFVSGLLGDIRFFLEMEIFRGVKLAFVLPLLLVSFVYIQKFPLFGEPVANGKEFMEFFRTFFHIPVRLGTMVLLAFLGIAAIIFVGRSGNTSSVPVPGAEIYLRRFLETVMYARPREKEFIIGHPAIILSLVALYRRWPQVLHYFLIIAMTIGQMSIVETFAHMRSPVLLSFVRGLDGLAAGTAVGIIVLLLTAFLLGMTKFLGQKYDRK